MNNSVPLLDGISTLETTEDIAPTIIYLGPRTSVGVVNRPLDHPDINSSNGDTQQTMTHHRLTRQLRYLSDLDNQGIAVRHIHHARADPAVVVGKLHLEDLAADHAHPYHAPTIL